MKGAMALGPRLLAADALHHHAAGAAHRHSRHRQQLHQPGAGHDAGGDRGTLRLPQHRRAGSRDSKWIGTEMEGYVFCAIIYFICCFAMSRYSMHLERKLHTGHKKR
jgi:hypothetical protein